MSLHIKKYGAPYHDISIIDNRDDVIIFELRFGSERSPKWEIVAHKAGAAYGELRQRLECIVALQPSVDEVVRILGDTIAIGVHAGGDCNDEG